MKTYIARPSVDAVSSTERISITYHSGRTDHATASASLPVLPELTAQYEPLVVQRERRMPTGGSFSEIKKSGEVKMTNGQIINTITENFLGKVEVREASLGTAVLGDANLNGENCKVPSRQGILKTGVAHATRSYTEQGDLTYWRNKYPSARYLSVQRAFPTNKVEAAKSAAYSELFTAYDLAEELIELRESLLYFKGKIDAVSGPFKKSAREYAKVLREKGHKEALSYWMQYRYAIMPVIYSATDVAKLLTSTGSFRTVRKNVYPDKTSQPIIPRRVRTFYELGVDGSTVSVTAKAGWSSSALAKADLINLNPLAAATKVHPYAFVVNWFLNIQDFAYAHLRSLTTTASSYDACVVYKTDVQKEVWFREIVDDRVQYHYDGYSGTCGYYAYPEWDYQAGDMTPHDMLLQRVTDRSYHRTTFKPNDVKIVWDPYLDWKRGLDSLALTLPKIEKSIRKLMK